MFVAAGFCAHGLAGAGGIGKVMAEWIVGRRAGAGPVGDGRPALRRALPLAVLHARAHARGLRDLLRHQVPRPRAPGGRPLRVSSAYAWHATHGAAFGEKSGWERVNWYEANAAAGDEALRPRGWAGMHWSPAIGAEHVACRERAGAVRRVVVRQDRGRRPGRRGVPGVAVRQPRRARRRRRSPTRRCSTARGGIECDFTVTRVEEELFSIVTGHGVRHPRPRVDPPPRARRRLGARRATSPRAGRASRCGARARATCWRR